ncbi:MAG: POTRA domain-containing protein [Desulfotignum sp.]|jgi:outer membrane protein insertion porin family|nr:POTRA domain-containing protein [Desulfotignum sp.]
MIHSDNKPDPQILFGTGIVFFLAMLWLVICVLPADAGDTRPVISEIRVEILGGTEKRQEKLHAMAMEMIRFQPGSLFTAKDLDTTITLLKQTGQFSRIDVPDQDMDALSIPLVFRLTPVMLVRKITVDGAFPIFGNAVVKVTDYAAGSAFVPDNVKKNVQAVKALMVEKGYVDAEVDITADPYRGLQTDILIEIKKHAPLKTVDIAFTGNTVFSDTRLRMRMKSYQLPLFFWSKGKRTIQKELETDIKNLVAYYRKKGFAEAAITYDVHTDVDKKAARVKIQIAEGPLYRISFSGNKEFMNYTLRKDITIWTKGNRNDFGLKRSIKNITDRYLKAGYRDCEVYFTADTEIKGDKPVRHVQIQINENTRYIVRSSVIKGSESQDAGDLKALLNTREKGIFYDGPFARNMVSDDTQILENYYDSAGFAQTQVSADVAWDAADKNNRMLGDVVFEVAEGYRRHVTRVTLSGLPEIFASDITQILQTREKEPFIPSQVDADRMAILSFLAEKGYIYADVQTRIDSDGKDYQVTFQVEPNTRATVGGVWVFGNFDTKDSVILRHNTLEKGEPVSLNSFVSLQKEIRNIQCIERADFKAVGIRENLDQVFFLTDVEEKKPYFLDTSIGYDTAKDAYMAVSAGNRNFLGTNRKLYLDAQVSGIGYDTILGITDFDFLSQHIYSDFNVYASEEEQKNQNFGSRKYGSSVSFEKQLTPQLKAGTAFNLESREQYATGTTAGVNPDAYEPRGIISATPFFTWSSVDSYAKPTSGLYFNASVGYNRDILEDLDNFVKYQVKAKYYIQPFSRVVLAFQAMYGTIQNFSDDLDLPDDQLFFLGGISDVRGFGENELAIDASGDPLGGKTQIAGSMEARIDLGNNFELPVFVDAGSLRDTTKSGSDEGFKFTLGSGLRYMTPVGPVGLLYGYRLNPETGEDSGKIHFSIGYTF